MAYNLQNLKVLLVEDNQPMMKLTSNVLRSFGVGEIVTCLNGEEGFRRFCDTNPDLVITDWMMSPWDGIKLSKEIRTNKKSPNQFVPIIIMTGFSEKRRVIDARDAGITEFMVKPFNTRDLYRRLYQIIERPRQFVKVGEFIGPDRRRKRREDDIYKGPNRREDDEGFKVPSEPVGDIDFQ